MKKKVIKNFTIDTPNKYWFVILGYHVHKGVIGLVSMPAGIYLSFDNFLKGAIVFILGLGIVIMDTMGHIHTNWHKTISFIEKHQPGGKYKPGGYKKMEVNKLEH